MFIKLGLEAGQGGEVPLRVDREDIQRSGVDTTKLFFT
jgi:hypothetical protein